MLGDFYGDRVAHSLESWMSDSVPPGEQVMEKHIGFANQAIDWSPDNGRYKELKARLLLLQLPSLSSAELFESIEQMLDLHRSAVEARPQWAFSWANIARLKSLLRQFDDEYRLALANVMLYGPYEVGAYERVIKHALENWHSIDLDTQILVLQGLLNGAEINARAARSFKQSLVAQGLQEQVCEQLSAHFSLGIGRERVCG